MLNKFDEEIETIDALFVDEFQDVDDVQAKIFTKVMAKKFFYIGDERQSIYIFRGAGPQNLRSLTDFERHTLNINYRSYQGIIDYANTMRDGDFICDTVKTKPCDITCARVDEDGEVYVIDKYNDCYDAVSGRQQDLMSTLTAFLLKKPYILCRSNKQVKAIESLGYRNVSTIHQAKGLEYANVIVTDMELSGEEEINIAYVACTRAQNGLLVCDPDLLYTYMNEILFEYRDEICGGKLF
jgi:superfamily I DNA/RNA helicase